MDASRRERKKQLTRQRIVSVAVRLFEERGYEKTSVAQIAEAADIDPKTFFNYFPSKDEVLFSELDLDVDVLFAAITRGGPDDEPAVALARAVRAYADHQRRAAPERSAEETSTIARLTLTSPALQAKAMYLLLRLQQQIACRLQVAFGGELDAVTAAATTGAVIGAIQQATVAAAALGHTQDELWNDADRALDIAVTGLCGTPPATEHATDAAPGAKQRRNRIPPNAVREATA